MANLSDWPIGAQVKAIEPLYGTVVTGKDEYGLSKYGQGVVVPAGSLGTIKQHFDDGRILVGFPCDPNCGHTFAEPKKFLKFAEGQIPDLLAEVSRLRAANAELVAACRALISGRVNDIQNPAEALNIARQAIAESEADNG